MKTPRPVILSMLLGACLHVSRAQEASLTPTNTFPDAVVASPQKEPRPLAETAVTLNLPAPAKDDAVYHLDTAASWRRPWNGDYDWLTLGTLFFGKMLDEHNALDAGFGGGVMQLKRGSPADIQVQQPFFLELGIAWRYYLAAPEASWNPYVTAGASVIWMTWEYRSPVDSSRLGYITRDYLEGLDGYAGVGLRLPWRKHLDCFGEMDIGGTGFLPTTYSGEHNNLFASFGYVGVKGGLSLKF